MSWCGQVTILNTVNTRLPFLPADEKMDVKEEVRLKTRVLDLRYGSYYHRRNVHRQCLHVSGLLRHMRQAVPCLARGSQKHVLVTGAFVEGRPL